MNKIHVKITKLNKNATIPTYGSEYAAGADLYACIDKPIVIKKRETVFVPTGLSMEIPEGLVGLIYARSGLACKKGLAPANKVGVVDSDYRGEVKVALHNDTNTLKTITAGDRIAQLIVMDYFFISDFEEVNVLSDTSRGEGGFGSTGE